MAKVVNYQQKKALLQEMLAFLHHANEEDYQSADEMLQHISDLSSDEDSPTRVNERSAAAVSILTTGTVVAAPMTLSGRAAETGEEGMFSL